MIGELVGNTCTLIQNMFKTFFKAFLCRDTKYISTSVC